MRFIDAHIHLSDEEYKGMTDRIIVEAKQSNVVALVSNSMNLKTSIESLRLTDEHRGMIYAAVGIHPWNVQGLTEAEFQQTLDFISNLTSHEGLVAIGEIGLDFKYEKIWEKQMRIFDEMLHLAEKLDLPAIIHSRGTTERIVAMLPSYKVKRILLHWFSNPISVLSKALEKGYYITEGVPTTYSNGIRDVVKRVPLTNLMTETDGPVHFFKPPFNGKTATPAFVPTVVKAIAEIKQMDVEAVAEQIIANFESFFGIRLN